MKIFRWELKYREDLEDLMVGSPDIYGWDIEIAPGIKC